MKWEDDLIKDIRFHDDRDDKCHYARELKYSIDGVPIRPPSWPGKRKRGGSFSVHNEEALINHFNRVKHDCEFILEIGVNNEPFSKSSTRVFIENKLEDE